MIDISYCCRTWRLKSCWTMTASTTSRWPRLRHFLSRSSCYDSGALWISVNPAIQHYFKCPTWSTCLDFHFFHRAIDFDLQICHVWTMPTVLYCLWCSCFCLLNLPQSSKTYLAGRKRHQFLGCCFQGDIRLFPLSRKSGKVYNLCTPCTICTIAYQLSTFADVSKEYWHLVTEYLSDSDLECSRVCLSLL